MFIICSQGDVGIEGMEMCPCRDLNVLYIKLYDPYSGDEETEVYEKYRAFIINSKLKYIVPMFNETMADGNTIANKYDIKRYIKFLLAKNKIYSDSFTVDIAVRIDGEMIVTALGDCDISWKSGNTECLLYNNMLN